MAMGNLRRSERLTEVLYDANSFISGRIVVLEHRMGCSALTRALRFFVPICNAREQTFESNEGEWDESHLIQSEVKLTMNRKRPPESVYVPRGFDGVEFASPSRLRNWI